MKARNVILRRLSLVTVLLIGSVTYGQASSISQKISQLLENVQTINPGKEGQRQAAKEPVRFSISADGYLRHLGAPPSYFFPVSSTVPGKPEGTAYNFIKEHANLLGAASAAVDFRVLKSKTKNNRDFVRFQQTYAGLPVFSAQVIVQLNAFGGVEYVLSDIARDIKVLDDGTVSLVPLIAKEKAIAIAKGLFTTEDPNLKISTTEPLLTIFDPSVLGSAGSIHLVWDMKVYSEEKAYINEHILLDSHTGNIVRRYPLNIPELFRMIFDANNTDADPGALIRFEGLGASGIADVDDAYDFLGDTYWFYRDYHGRDSIDDEGMTISATVRYCYPGEPCPWQNAQWSSGDDRMYFGDGMAADDIVGHEYTHGVTDYESELVYEDESGAINESFSDIWGEFIDLTNGAGTDTDAVRWEIGEDSWGGTCRDMREPGQPPFPNLPQPDRWHGEHWYNGSDQALYVHINSGVGNKLCYLLTDGDIFGGWTVSGMGISRVADLYYEVQTQLLSSGADYRDLYDALIQAAVNLNWTSGERSNLYRACDAVEIAGPGKDIYVDVSYTGWPEWPEFGTKDFPFNTLAEGEAYAYPGDRLHIRGGSYNERIIFDKTMEIETWDGTVIIGE
jgi:Zn-dependent metalloprotease